MDVERLRWAVREAQERMDADPAFRWAAEMQADTARADVLTVAAEFIAHLRIRCPVGPGCRASVAVAWVADQGDEHQNAMLMSAIMLIAELTERHGWAHPDCERCVKVEGKVDGKGE